MAIAKDILNYLTQPENLALALEISDHVDELKRQTHYDFWIAFNHEIQTRLSESDLHTQWAYQPFDVERMRTDWNQAYMQPVLRDDPVSFLQFAVGQASSKNNFSLMWGVLWNKTPENYPSLSLANLKSTILANKMTIMDAAPRWLGWNYLPYTPFTYSFIHRMHSERESFVGEVVETVWKAFQEMQADMHRINQSVLQG